MMASAGEEKSRTYQIAAGSSPLVTNYLPTLDGWRAVSILLVLISHGGLGHIIPGGFGVTIFFFISGFLITSLLINELQKNNDISLKKFYMRRFWRLSPPLFVYVAASLLFIYLVDGSIIIKEVFSAVFYFANYYSIYWHFEPMASGPSPLKILWSLAIEEHYYLFFAPLLIYFGYSSKRLLLVLAALALGPLLLRCAVVYGADQDFVNTGYTYMATEARIDSIAWGGIFAWMAARFETTKLKSFLDAKITVVISILILLLCFAIRDDRFRESIRYTLQGIALISIFYSSICGNSLIWLRPLFSSKFAVLIGKYSYSIYLYHWLALTISNWLIGPEKLRADWLLLYYSLTIVFAIASYKLIEQPTLAMRRKFGSHAAKQ